MTTELPQQRPSMRVAGLRTALVATVGLTAVAALAAAVLAGRPQLNGALAGAALVAGFFLFGALSTSLAAAYAPGTALLVALLTYTSQVVLLGVVLVGVERSGATPDSLDVRWLAGTVIAGTLCWTTALVVDAARSQQRNTSTGEVRR
jgi:ATP synthase protein I